MWLMCILGGQSKHKTNFTFTYAWFCLQEMLHEHRKLHPARPSWLETRKIHPYTHLNPYLLPQLTCGLAATPTHTWCHHLPAFLHCTVTYKLQLFRCHFHKQTSCLLQGEVPCLLNIYVFLTRLMCVKPWLGSYLCVCTTKSFWMLYT